MNQTAKPTILVLGAYGLIGAWVCRHLLAQGYRVTGLGRDARTAKTVLPQLDWKISDLRDLQTDKAWRPLLNNIAYVVNCAGTLQNGARDDTDQVQHRAIAAMAKACMTSNTSIIQISAVGADPSASTAFMRTKAEGDAAVRQAGVPYWIIRPGLVLAPNAYGGTALIRMLAAMPLVQPLALAQSPIQTTSLDDVCQAVEQCIEGQVQPNTQADLVAPKTHTLAALVAAHRTWLGFKPANMVWDTPDWMVKSLSNLADGLGRLGWRSALRSTAVRALQDGVTGDASNWLAAGGAAPKDLHATLQSMPATTEHRLAARMALLFTIIMATLFIFWLVSGLMGLFRLDEAAKVLEQVGWSSGFAKASVIAWSLVDIALAITLLVRRFAPLACLLMVAVSLVYLLASTVLLPGLWLDPLGPLVKILPSLVLALVARALLETR